MTFYETLGVTPDASIEEITAAYRALAAPFLPGIDDSPDAEERFHELTSAYRVLVDPAKRRDYDTFLTAGGEELPRQPQAGRDAAPAAPPQAPPAPRPEPGRVKRRARRRHNRAVALWILAGVAATAVVVWLGVLAWRDVSGDDVASPSPQADGRSSDLAVFSVGGEQPLAAIVGSGGGRPPVVAWVPGNLLTPSGSGGGSVSHSFAESAAIGRTVLSNVTGTWISDYAQIEPSALADIVSARSGLTIDLPAAMELGKRMVGPGPTRLAGPQVVAYLREASGDERDLRWSEVLAALFDEDVPLPGDAESNDADAVAEILAGATGAEVAELPTVAAEGPYRRVDAELMRRGMRDLFGVEGEDRVEVILFLGIDRPGLAERATQVLVPKGFHVAGYQRVRGLDKGRVRQATVISYYGDDLRDEAERIRQALGVGKVVLSEIGSGVGNISVMLGKDYAASLGG